MDFEFMFYLPVFHIFLNSIFIISVYKDLESRKISNLYLKMFYLTYSIPFLMEMTLYKDFLLMKPIYVSIVIFLSFLLLYIDFIGGADAKLMILIFLVFPVKYLKFYMIFRFLLFFIIYYVFFLIVSGVIQNFFKRKTLFNTYLNEKKVEGFLNRLNYKLLYRLVDISVMKNDSSKLKYKIKEIYTVPGENFNIFKILVLKIPPMTLFIVLAYYTFLILN